MSANDRVVAADRSNAPRFARRAIGPTVVFAVVMGSLHTPLSADQRAAPSAQAIPLYDHRAPDAIGDRPEDMPQLIPYVLEREKAGPAIVVLPGGGYGMLASDHEGHQIAQWLNECGISAFICLYRHHGQGYRHPVPWHDAQRAIRMVRARADAWHVDPNRVGILGFSAGGHLASHVTTCFDAGESDSPDLVARQSSRPDVAILCYPVIAWGESFTHTGSQHNLLGADATAEQLAELSTQRRVGPQTPPTFLWHTREDTAVPPENSLVFYASMLQHGVPGELHIFERGPHGIGLAKGQGAAEAWPGLCEQWLRGRGFTP
jgi:acetyl esterase/lipase